MENITSQIQDKISGLEDKVDELKHSDNDKEESMRKYKWNVIKRTNVHNKDRRILY